MTGCDFAQRFQAADTQRLFEFADIVLSLIHIWLNDRAIQLTGICIAADSNSTENSSYLCSNSSSGVSRSAADTGAVRNAGKTAWKNFSSANMSPNAANTGW